MLLLQDIEEKEQDDHDSDDDIADDIADIEGLGAEQAAQLIMKAREPWFQ